MSNISLSIFMITLPYMPTLFLQTFDCGYAELPQYSISSSPAAAAPFPGSDISAFIVPFKIG